MENKKGKTEDKKLETRDERQENGCESLKMRVDEMKVGRRGPHKEQGERNI